MNALGREFGACFVVQMNVKDLMFKNPASVRCISKKLIFIIQNIMSQNYKTWHAVWINKGVENCD